MGSLLLVMVFLQLYFTNSLGWADSCYFCTGTPQCGDPMDYDEVSPRRCLKHSVCLKYISSSKNKFGDVVAHDLTYRKCFKTTHLNVDVCTFVKTAEEKNLKELNHTLIAFECYVCHNANCNSAVSLSSLRWICLFVLFLNLLLSSV